ncbi:MAG TPA: hypothetical protein VK277_03610 [Acidimicrobiales bacterium]|nr:hypothetical protein [Acidimicrobiales bacterium]
MSDVSQGPGWWLASDGKWYPPEAQPGPAPTSTGTAVDDPSTGVHAATGAVMTTPDPVLADRPAGFQVAPDQVMPPAAPVADTWQPEVPAEPAPAAAESTPSAWPVSPAAAAPSDSKVKAAGGWVLVLGLAVIIWGVGFLMPAIYYLQHSHYLPKLISYGALVSSIGIIIMGLITLVIGSILRRD